MEGWSYHLRPLGELCRGRKLESDSFLVGLGEPQLVEWLETWLVRIW